MTATAFDADGFLHTGDLATIDAEGWVTITGRLKDVIIRKGENISAKEVEDVLYQHASIADVAVVGLPDAERGERACAVIVVAPAADGPPLSLSDLASHCRAAGLAVHKVPEQVELVDELPRNPSGKVLKYLLRDRFGG
jgi:acyl-CoA synthetase (AMP-forming)/AMP-acid ligase II